MADKFGSSDIPLSERGARSHDFRSEVTESRRPPARRDPRADPDDEPTSERVDVVQVERGEPRGGASVDVLTNAALTLRRELAKLHQQAAAVERTIEDQRRERSDALERVEAAEARAAELEGIVEAAEAESASTRRLYEAALAELQTVRAERDDLRRAIEMAMSATDELTRAKSELEAVRQAHDEALRASAKVEAELAEIRKREAAGAEKGEAELQAVRERLERATAELGQAKEESAQAKDEIARLKQEAGATGEEAARLRGELEREQASANQRVERLEGALAEARAIETKLATATNDLSAARVESAEARAEVHRLERDLEAARHARDVNLERATMAERETEAVRAELERLKTELEAQSAATARAETRARGAEKARALVEDSVGDLRDEVAAAFSRWRAGLPPSKPSSPPGATPVPSPFAPSPSSLTMPGNASGGESSPPTRRGSTSFPPMVAEARPFSLTGEVGAPPDEHGWSSPPPPAAQSKKASTIPPIPAPSPMAATAIGDDALGGASPTSRSVPPPPPPRRSSSSALAAQTQPGGESPAEARSPSMIPPPIPPAVYPSVPPPAIASVTPTPGSVPPPAISLRSARNRDSLFEQLADPEASRTAAELLRERPEWLVGRPPLELLEALTSLDYDVEAPVFELARSWEREPICRALVAALRDEPEPKLREHGAWLLKHLGSASALPVLSDMLMNEAEASVVRRWLLEAIERLVAAKSVGWTEVQGLVTTFVRHSDPVLRDGAITIVAALDKSDVKRRLLLDVLRSDDDEMVLASAVHALAGILPVELDPSVTERLLGHPSARVQRSVMDFVERSRRR